MDEGALIRALTESRSALIAESGSDTYEPTIPALMALLSKHPNLTGTKLTTNMVMRRLGPNLCFSPACASAKILI